MNENAEVRNPYGAPASALDAPRIMDDGSVGYDNDARYVVACVLSCVAWALAMGNKFYANTVVAAIWKEVGLSDLQIGLVTVVSSLTAIMLGVPAGMLADRASRRMMVIVGLLVACVAALLRFSAHESGGLIAASFLDGVAETLVITATIALIARLSPLARGAIVGLAICGGLIVSSIVSIAVGFVGGANGPRAIALYLAVTIFTIALLLLFIGKDVARKTGESGVSYQSLSMDGMSNVGCAHLIIAGALLIALAGGVTGFSASMLVRVYGASVKEVAQQIGVWSPILWLFAVAGGLVTAWLNVRALRQVPMLMAGAGVAMLLSIASATTADSVSAASFGFAVMRAVSVFAQASVFTTIACAFASGSRGLAAGAFLALSLLAMRLSTVAVGVLSDSNRAMGGAGGLRLALQVMAVAVVWALVHLWVVRREIVEVEQVDQTQ